MISALQSQVEQDLSRDEPEVEVLLAEVVGGTTLRVFIDHPEGVTLALCERVSATLSPWRERYTLEVSSPGSHRPLTKPAHFRRFVGQRARVRMRAQGTADGPHGGGRTRRPPRRGDEHSVPAGPRSLTGELLGATEDEVTLAADGGVVTIPYAQIRRCNLVGA